MMIPAYLGCFLSSLFMLIASDQCNDEVHLQKLFLLSGEILVGAKLCSDSLGKLVPIEVSNKLLEVLAIDLVIAAASLLGKGTHIHLNQIVMLEGAGEMETGARWLTPNVVLNSAELL